MKIKSKSKNNKIAIVTSIALLVLIGGGITYALTSPVREDNKSSELPNSSNSSTSDEKTVSDNTQKTATNTDQPAPTTVDDTTGKKVVQVMSSHDISNNTIYLRGGINNAVVSDGICYALLTGPSGHTIKKDTALLQNASTTDCKTIAISLNELSKGVWTYILNYTSDSMEGKSNANTFEI